MLEGIQMAQIYVQQFHLYISNTRLTASFPGQASTRKVKPVWI